MLCCVDVAYRGVFKLNIGWADASWWCTKIYPKLSSILTSQSVQYLIIGKENYQIQGIQLIILNKFQVVTVIGYWPFYARLFYTLPFWGWVEPISLKLAEVPLCKNWHWYEFHAILTYLPYGRFLFDGFWCCTCPWYW